MTSGSAFPPEVRASAIADYQAGEIAPSIAARLGSGVTTIYQWLADAGVPRKTSWAMTGCGSPALPPDVLTAAWSSSEAGAWAIGIHVTDGHLRQPKGRPGQTPSLAMRLVLKSEDHVGVKLLADAYGITRDRVRSVGDMSVLGFSHPRLRFLADIGQPIGKKTAEAALPEHLTMNTHALRGVIDGDGYVSLLRPSGPGRSQPQLHLGLRTSSPTLKEQFATASAQLLGDTVGICVHDRGVTVTNAAATGLIAALYLNAQFSIPRKRMKALSLAAEYGNAVTPPVAELIVSALVEAITGDELERRQVGQGTSLGMELGDTGMGAGPEL
jgi:hypothetical protein